MLVVLKNKFYVVKQMSKKATGVVFVLLFCFIADLPTNLSAQTNPGKRFRLVIDPGHGGKDPGAVGKIHHEKDIVLSVALRFGRLIEEWFPDVEVIYTRDNDYFVEVAQRSVISNKAHADLFISIHANGNDNRTAVGSETWVMGLDKSQKNMEVAKRENSVISLEDNYETKYEGFDPNSAESYIMFQFMQSANLSQSIKMAELLQDAFSHGPIQENRGVKQGPFWVLWATAAPCVLIEVGFMSNAEEERKLGMPESQQEIAECMLQAFHRYKRYFDQNGQEEL